VQLCDINFNLLEFLKNLIYYNMY